MRGQSPVPFQEKNPSHNRTDVKSFTYLLFHPHMPKVVTLSHLRNRVVANGYGFVFCETTKSFSSLPTPESGGNPARNARGPILCSRPAKIRFGSGPPTGRTFAHCGMLSTDCEKKKLNPGGFPPAAEVGLYRRRAGGRCTPRGNAGGNNGAACAFTYNKK